MKRYKPTTKSNRQTTHVEFKKFLTKSEPLKSLTTGFRRANGRNNTGRITTRHKGGGHKRLFRDIDFTYNKPNVPFTVKTVEYDPNRSGFIGLVAYKDGERRYALLPKNVKVGDTFIASDNAPLVPGNKLPLKNIPVGTFIYNVELKSQGGARVARSGGNYVEVSAKDGGYVDIKMPSSEVRKVPENAWATIGEVSNDENRLTNLGKAGRSRWLGIRPTVRGTAMNPVDHPHGGGEGRQGRGRRRAISIYGKPTGKGQKSRRAKKYSNKFIVRRRKVGKK
ncbi:MAG: Translation protein SH3-like protein [Parcubacteria group bacterium]|nr:Translation protein SH3-like protein [Parcubacteria group bacterium]